MRLPTLTLIAVLGAALLAQPATARPSGDCAALSGRDLAPGPEQRAVRRGGELRFCARGGTVRRLGGSPTVQGADGHLLLLRRRGRIEVLDVSTGRRARLGAVAEIVQAEVVDHAGAVALRRTTDGDAIIVAAPGRALVVVERGAGPVEGLRIASGLSWTRAGTSREALLPLRALRCDQLRGDDQLSGRGRIVSRGSQIVRHVGCVGGGDAPTYLVGEEEWGGLDTGAVTFTAGHGSWVLRESSYANQYYASRDWSAVDLATGRITDLASRSGGFCCDDAGEDVREPVVLADGRVVAILDSAFAPAGGRRSAVVVTTPGGDRVELDHTEGDAPKANTLRVAGHVVHWTVGGEARSAPLPPVG